jgi:hypothetical protein
MYSKIYCNNHQHVLPPVRFFITNIIIKVYK